MQFTIPTKSFGEMIVRAKSVISARSTMPVLSNVMIEGDEIGGVTITATDMERRISVKNPNAEVFEAGSITVPCDRLAATVSLIDAEKVDISTDENDSLCIKGGARKTNMMGLKIKEFPAAIDDKSARVEFSVKGSQLAFWLKALSPFQATEAARYMLISVNFASSPDGFLTLHAADGRALLKIQTNIPVKPVNCIVPASGIKAITSTIPTGDVQVSIGMACIKIWDDTWCFECKLLEETYPNIGPIIDGVEGYKFEMTANRAELIRALTYAETFCDQNIRVVHIKAAGGTAALTASMNQIGSSEATINASGESEFDINPAYFGNMLKSIPADEVTILGGDNGLIPVMIRHDEYTAVAMPLRLK